MNSETGLLYGLLNGLVVQTFRNYQMHFLKQKACSEKWHCSHCLRGPAGSGILENINIKGLSSSSKIHDAQIEYCCLLAKSDFSNQESTLFLRFRCFMNISQGQIQNRMQKKPQFFFGYLTNYIKSKS